MRRFPPWIGAACLVLLASAVFAARVRHEMADFEVYRVGGARVVAGESLYRAEDGHWQFKYLPVFGFAVAPLSQLPPLPARAIWFALLVGLLVVLLNRSLALLPDRRHGSGFLVGLTAVALGKFYLHEINLGQSNLLLGAAVIGAVAAWRGRRDATAGALLAAAAMVKPYAIVFLPYLIVRRRWRSGAAFAGVLVAALALPALRYGWSGNLSLLGQWWAVITTSTAPNLLGQDNVSIAGMYAAWLGIGPAATWLAAGTSVLVVLACGYALILRTPARFPAYLDVSLLLFVIPLLSPQGWDYVLLLGTPAVMLLLDRLGEFARPQRWLLLACMAIVGLTIWDLLGRDLYSVVMMSRVVTLCALCQIWFLIRLRARGAA
ncbi:MAG: glycosyltransferase family 87 protein [Acidobacteriota bacterium]